MSEQLEASQPMPEETLNGPLPNDPPQTEPQDPDEVVIGERDDL